MTEKNDLRIRILHHDTEGLANDARVIREIFPQATVVVYPETDIHSSRNSGHLDGAVDIQIFLEHVKQSFLRHSRTNIIIPNPEFFTLRDEGLCLKHGVLVFCKTIQTYNTLCARWLSKNNLRHVGWSSRDMYDNAVPRQNEWLHVKGCSRFKNTQMILRIWMRHPEWPRLRIISYGDEEKNGFVKLPHPIKVNDNIVLYQFKLHEDELKKMMNVCKYHICPSSVEGFGHTIHEGLSCGASVVTTDAPPMNTHVPRDFLVRCEFAKYMNCGFVMNVDELDMEMVIQRIIENVTHTHFSQRKIYVDNKKGFHERFTSSVVNSIS